MEEKHFVYAGTWTIKDQGGIGIYRFFPESGRLEYCKTVREDIVAGFMILDREKQILYAADERTNNPDFGRDAGGGGRVFALKIDPETGEIEEINHQSAYGPMTACIAGDGTGKGLVACNHSAAESVTKIEREESGRYRLSRVYSDTTIVHYPISDNGEIGEPDDIYVTEPEEGLYSCLHSVMLAPDGHTLIVCERNQDKVYRMHVSKADGRLVTDEMLRLRKGGTAKTGSCPRYSAFHPVLPLVYVNSEYMPEIAVLRYDGKLELTAYCDVSLPGAGDHASSQSDFCISGDGRFLYALYRGIDAVGVFRIDMGTGLLELAQEFNLPGNGPRGCRLSPDGRFLLVAELDSGDIVTLKVEEDGRLSTSGFCASGQKNPGNIIFF